MKTNTVDDSYCLKKPQRQRAMRGQRQNKIGYECFNNSIGLKIIAGYCNRLAPVLLE